MKIIIADKISPLGVEFLQKQAGFEVVEAYGSSPEQILDLSKDASAIIVRSETKVTKEVMENAPKLKAVGRAGVGVDNIDVEAATRRGVVVMNTPGGNTTAAAELTFTHMLCGARPVAQALVSMREGRWDRKELAGIELFQKTLGICGLGRIRAEVAKRAKAFGMETITCDPFLSESRAKALGVKSVELDELYAQSDYITVHLPLTDKTRNMINEEAIAKMKDGVRIVNCARGGIIKESALVKALESGKVASAGLDVFEEEPLSADSPLRSLPTVTLTPHLGASTKEAQESVGLEIAQAISDVLRDGGIRNAINMPSLDAQTLSKVGPYLDLCAALGTMTQQLALAKVENVKIVYYGKILDLDANSLTRSVLRGFLREISDNVNFVNALVLMEQLGLNVDVVKSSEETDYTELIRVEAACEDGSSVSAEGTLIGRNKVPRVVSVNGREIELEPRGCLLMVANRDETGIVGQLGTIIGKDGVNIAAMSLSRNEVGGVALNVAALDSELSKKAIEEIRALPAIVQAKLVRI